MQIIDKITEHFESNLGKQTLNYFLFYACIWAFHLIIISVVSFFHLILNHNIGVIADWIVDRGWILIILTKILIFAAAVQFMRLRTKNYVHIRGLLRNAISWPRHENFVVALFLLLGIISLGNIRPNDAYILDFSRLLFSILGTILFFGIDVLFILILDVFNPITNEEEKNKKILFFAIYFFLFNRITFLYEQMTTINLLAYFYLILFSAYWRRRNWTLPLFVIVTFFIPAFVLFGFDPIWDTSFSIFKYGTAVKPFSMFILIAFSISYFYFRSKKYPEYIYRD